LYFVLQTLLETRGSETLSFLSLAINVNVYSTLCAITLMAKRESGR
jgi:hypothetical protein